MSGLLHEVATPCPPRLRTSGSDRSSGRSDTFDSLWEENLKPVEDTANLDFTTEIKAPTLTGAKPRRRTKAGTSFLIHDDGEGKSIQPDQKRQRETGTTASGSNRKSSLLAQPAQRFRPKVSFTTSPSSKQPRQLGGIENGEQSTELDTEKNRSLLMQINGEGADAQRKDVLRKGIRRNTVFIPPDDTTVARVFMNLFSPLKSNGIGHHILEDGEINSLESQIARRRQAKKVLASFTQRVPLQPCSKIAQESSFTVDVVGKNGGKENIPPGTILMNGKDKSYQHTKPKETPNDIPTINGPSQRAVLCVKQSNVKASTVNIRLSGDTLVKRKSNSGDKALRASRSTTLSTHLKHLRANRHVSQSTPNIMREFPLITENVTNPSMYEDDWLSHQEVVITQLFNGLFEHTNGNSTFDNPQMLRHSLLELYQTESFTQLHKRLQASLLYGSMSIPKDVIPKIRGLMQDLGLKRKFLDIWVQTYDLEALRAAAETITGRTISIDSMATRESTHGSSKGEITGKDKVLKRKLEIFLDAFLLQNKDMDQRTKDTTDGDSGIAGRAYRRTILRSIMLIILLDKGRKCPETMLPRRLFLSSSPFKSSAAVAQALARLLLPSSGDILKSLNHLDCQLSYEQHQLQEYEYRLSNLAVDLRDGVKLTRIVEMLLYPSTSFPKENGTSLLEAEDQWPLSRYLKYPCLSRAVKLSNVQIALDALASTKDAGKLASNVRAEDIVDGHREKTIVLCWGLASKRGLSELIDWDDVRKEIDRLKHKAISQFGYEQVNSEDWYKGGNLDGLDEGDNDSTSLLEKWASILARLNGLHLENLSTSFADGKIYEAIVNEYEGYRVEKTGQGNTPDQSRQPSPSLGARLRALGCSSQFANLVSPDSSKAHILNNDFTVGVLAFLCSRLLSATKRARAATVIQDTWRRILARRELQRRNLARNVAIQCATVVQTRDQMLWAKEVIVRWWREIRARKQRRNKAGSQSGKRLHTAKRVPRRVNEKYNRTRGQLRC